VKSLNRKNLVLGTILTLSLLIVTVVVAVGPASARFNVRKDNSIDVYGTGGRVTLSLPPPGVGPPLTGGVQAHPTDLNIIAVDFDKRSETGAHDFLMVSVWVQSINTYVPIAAVFDIPIPDYWKQMWNSTGPANPFWYETSAGVSSGHSNSFQVTDKELEVWTESTRTYCGCGNKGWNYQNNDVLMVNLTKPIIINFTSAQPGAGNLSFTIPPMTLTFQGIAEGHPEMQTLNPGTWIWIQKETEVPAYVNVAIPSWVRGAEVEVVGHISESLHNTFTSPSP
jgi:hypothetical protein